MTCCNICVTLKYIAELARNVTLVYVFDADAAEEIDEGVSAGERCWSSMPGCALEVRESKHATDRAMVSIRSLRTRNSRHYTHVGSSQGHKWSILDVHRHRIDDNQGSV